MSETLVAIHQPTYLPWLGFFDKLRRSDVVIILDDVQIQRTGSSWVNRTQILSEGKTLWLTIPIHRPSGLQQISATKIVDEDFWKKRHRGLIHTAYRMYPHYRTISPILDEVYGNSESSLLEFNIFTIRKILELLESNDAEKFVFASSFNVKSGGTSRLVELVKRSGGDSYLCGAGSTNYLQPEKFADAGVLLKFQNFVEVERPQNGTSDFVKGLSVLDSLSIIGARATSQILGGRR
jgi:hypothetical protein